MSELDPLLQIDNRNVELQARAQILLESTVLHELVHYIRRVDGGMGSPQSNADRIREEKVARRFERDAYGERYTTEGVYGIMTVRSLGLTQFMPRTALKDLDV